MSSSERRRSYGYGIAALAGVIGFIAIAIIALSGFGRLQASVAVFEEPYIWRILRFTLWQATLSTVLSVALAIPSRWRWRGGRIFLAGSGSCG